MKKETFKERVLKKATTKELVEILEKREGVEKLRQLEPGAEVVIDGEVYSGPLILLNIID